MKFAIIKYQSVIYLLFFVFQVTFCYSAKVQSISIQFVQGSSHDSNDSEPSSNQDDLIDYENDDSEENQDNEENEEEQEIDSEIDFVKDVNALRLYQDYKSGHYKYVSFFSTIKIEELFSPPEV